MKYVKNKPVRDLTGDQYLKLTLAESDRLITVSISERIDGITSSSYIEEVKQLYYRVRIQISNQLKPVDCNSSLAFCLCRP
jgi:tRNA A37 N6-isopentenylltransferase MiaA